MHWIYLHFHSLQLESLATAEYPPIAIVDPHRFEVRQLNASAQQLGLKLGMGLAMALSLSDQGQNNSSNYTLVIKEYSEELEQERLTEIASCLYQLTADIVLDPPQGLFLRIDTMLVLYKSIDEYWQRITSCLLSFNVTCHYASASTPYMAQVLALSKVNRLFTCHVEAKEKLASLPIHSLQITAQQKEQLSRVGIKKVENLLTVPLKEMAKRFDLSMFTYLGELTGQLKSKLRYFKPKRQYQYTLELMFEVSNSSILKKPIKKVLNNLEKYLKVRNLVTNHLYLQFNYRYNEFTSIEVNRAQGEYRAIKWLELIALKLESLKLAEPVLSIRLIVKNLQPLTTYMEDMFSTKNNRMKEDELHAHLIAKLGNEEVYRLSYQAHIEPTKTTRLEPLMLQSSTVTNKPKLAFDIRPSYLKAIPERLNEAVTLIQGPERIVAGWWDFTPYSRDYFIAVNELGQKIWVYRTPANDWFLHGYFS